MKTKPYPQLKKDTICLQPKEAIFAFCMEIATPAWKSITLKLPPVNGFRRGTAPEIKERFKIYIRRMQNWNDKDWDMFSDLWLAWIKTYPSLNDLLSQYNNDQDFQDDVPVPPNSQLDIDCFKFLVSESEQKEVPRELIKKFYDYGYFLEDQKIEAYISLAKSDTELKMQKCQNQMADLLKKIDSLESLTKGDLETIKQELQTYNNNINFNFETLEKNVKKLEAYYSEQICLITEDFDHKIEETVARMSLEIASHLELSSGHDNQEFEALKRAIPKSILFEKMITSDEYVENDSIKDLDKALIRNLKSIGMTSSGAKQFSKEIIAAILSQGTITFKGSFATILARLCAKTISANNTSICYIPIGLVEGNHFRTIFDNFIGEASVNEMVSTLIIEGANLSSFEAYAQILYRDICEQVVGIKRPKTIKICTLADGPTALDCSLILCDSGPVFDTDCLEWRGIWEPNDIQNGMTSQIKLNEWISSNVNVPENWDELYNEFSCLGGIPSILGDRYLRKAAMYINSMNASNTTMQSLAFGWLIPRGIVLNIDFSLYLNQIADGKIDGEQADKRINRLLAPRLIGV